MVLVLVAITLFAIGFSSWGTSRDKQEVSTWDTRPATRPHGIITKKAKSTVLFTSNTLNGWKDRNKNKNGTINF